jgi:hypothetical protein
MSEDISVTECKVCHGNIIWDDENAMFRTKPFPICDECLETLREIVKDKKEQNNKE